MKGDGIDRKGSQINEYRLFVTALISLESRAYDQLCDHIFSKAGITLEDF